MASSTSSSSPHRGRGDQPAGRAAPPGSVRALVAGIVVAALLVAAAELSVRRAGLQALTVHDTPERWLQQRERAARLGDESIVLLGASRIQAGIDLPTLRASTGADAVQLAISANPVMPVFQDISWDEDVTGLVVVSLTVEDLYEFTRDTQAERYVQLYDERHNASPVAYAPLERWLRSRVDAWLVSRATGFHPSLLMDGLGGPARRYVRTLPDRSQKIDYTLVDRDRAYRERLAKYVSADQIVRQVHVDFDARVAELNSAVRRIQARGGRVVLVRFPSSKGIWRADEIRYPKAEYWDRLAALTDAAAIHFMDHPGLREHDLPDGVHLDQSQTPAFTAALAGLLPLADRERAARASTRHRR